MAKTASAVPRVICYTRHSNSCRWTGDESKLSCDCPKWLRWHRQGRMFRQKADTRDGDVAMKKALDMTASFEAVANGAPPLAPTVGKLLDDAITTFIDTKKNDGVTDKHIEKYRYELNEFASFMQARGLMNLGDMTPE